MEKHFIQQTAKQRTKNSDKIRFSLTTPNTLIINNYALVF